MARRSSILAGLSLTILLFCAALVAGPALQSGPAAFHENGPFTVATVDSLDLADQEREKDVTVKVYYPDGDGPFPVIVFSHGLGQNKDAFGEVTRHWASHGYVTVHPTHDDRGVSMSGGSLNPPAEKILDRLRDVTAVLDGFDQLEARIPGLRGKLDRDNVGVSGHSYGSFITMAAGGVTAEVGPEKNKSLADARVKCIVPIATAGRGDYGLNDESWNNLTLPALFFGGTRDLRAGRSEDWRLEPFQFSPAGDKYLLMIDGANHGAYGGYSPGNDAPTYVKAAGVAFWDACLRASDTAKAYLDDENGFRRFAGQAAALSAK